MGLDRRNFMKLSGVTAVGLATGSLHNVLAQETETTSLPQERLLTARRWAMIVDLRKCRQQDGCTDCISACHRVHNVPDFGNPKDEIKWIWKEDFEHAFHEQEFEHVREDLMHSHVLLLCNHCDNPPCTRVCPTQATWRRERDGIVMMDWHRCIGCRYCVAACPYGSRSFNWRDPRPFIKDIQSDFPTRMRGVVEKCTFCEERLAKGQLPACVEACRDKALIFGDLEDPNSEVRQVLSERFAIRRKPSLGTQPEVYYLV
ncbi:MAG: sulfate reduction electron transfer complex DsrMKJOP subunit DsrO [Candidatus Zixiibacteriota bacterium]